MFEYTNETLYPIWNTTAGGHSTESLPGVDIGSYWESASAEKLFDMDLETVYTNHGECTAFSLKSEKCGVNTGFYITLNNGSFILAQFQIAASGILNSRDPVTMTIEGSNRNSSELTLGSSWTLIYEGSTGLEGYRAESRYGSKQILSDSSKSFTSFRILITSILGEATCTSYSEFMMMGRFI